MDLVLPTPVAHFNIADDAVVVYHFGVKCKEDPAEKGSIHVYSPIWDSNPFFDKHLQRYFTEWHV